MKKNYISVYFILCIYIIFIDKFLKALKVYYINFFQILNDLFH